ncbi:glycosyltransferase family 4 protein [Arcticibacter sp. MXS-1]|uniref:glycosyltransferase family 4 protein n=1 Tax=Arcticibacter sp. MXS-1 TaxID=3341726 RepID=UPI0035A8E860
MISTQKAKIVIVSSILEDWGGSEELWAKALPFLQSAGFQLYVMKYKINFEHPKFVELAAKGVILEEYQPKKPKQGLVARVTQRLYRAATSRFTKKEKQIKYVFTKKILQISPDLVIIAQGINFDGLGNAYQCAEHGIPYIVVAQKAVDFYWPQDFERSYMKAALLKAKRCFFVSQHNARLTEEQFGMRLANAEVIQNPVKIRKGVIKYPTPGDEFRLACIGRLFLLDKGQDILIRILAQSKWQERPVKVSFIGTGVDRQGLQEMAAFLNVKNVEFIGHVDDIEEIWKSHHALVLPSRSEGQPLAMLEAMAAGRPVIVSRAGGIAEVVQEGKNGFIGHANEDSFDAAMERAWAARYDWENMGREGAERVAKLIPYIPEDEFAARILTIASGADKIKSETLDTELA